MNNKEINIQKASLMAFLFLLSGFCASAQQEKMFVYRMGTIIFEKAVAEIDSVLFHKTPRIALNTFNQKDTMFVYRSGEVIFSKTVIEIDSVNFRKSELPAQLVIKGMLDATTVQGCSVAAAPAPANTVAALEMMPGSVTISDECTENDFLAVSSTDDVSSGCPVIINRTYTIKDVCGNSATITHLITIRDTSPPSFNSVNIPAGTFIMGSPTNEAERDLGETQHLVTLSAFRMSKYEITNAQYAEFLNAKSIGADGLYAAGTYPTKVLIISSIGEHDWGLHYTAGKWVSVTGYENHPVIFVTWYGALEFATFEGGRLPTEAEWEYACRAGTITPFNTGNCLSEIEANYDYRYPYTNCPVNTSFTGYTTRKVDSYATNAWGLYNMHGNVWEWCSDWWEPYSTASQTNPTGAVTGSIRLLRGGGNSNVAGSCRSAMRNDRYAPDYNSWTTGFRLVFQN